MMARLLQIKTEFDPAAAWAASGFSAFGVGTPPCSVESGTGANAVSGNEAELV